MRISAIAELMMIYCVLVAALVGSILYDAKEKALKIQEEQAKSKPESVDPSLQNSVLTPEGLIITKDFNDSSMIKFANVELCQSDMQGRPGYYPSLSCHDNRCSTIIDFGDKPIPVELTVNRNYNGSCVKQTVPDLTQYRIYTIDVTISPALEKQLKISTAKVHKTANSKFSDSLVAKHGKDTVITFEYETARPLEDEFLLDSKTVQLLYNLKTSAPQP